MLFIHDRKNVVAVFEKNVRPELLSGSRGGENANDEISVIYERGRRLRSGS